MAFQDPFARVQAVNQSQATSYDMGLRAYMLKIYNYMASALALTGITSLFAANSPAVMSTMYQINEANQIVGMTGLGWIVAFAPLVMALGMGFGIMRLSLASAQALFWAFSVVMGLSLSSLFLAYTGESIARAFFITAATFGGMSIYGYTTKRDLTGIGSFLIMGVWGLIIASLVNIFLQSSGLSFAISAIAVLVFTGLTAYDTQRLKEMYYQMAGAGEMAAKMAVMGALNLYMDFINLFIALLRFVGDRR